MGLIGAVRQRHNAQRLFSPAPPQLRMYPPILFNHPMRPDLAPRRLSPSLTILTSPENISVPILYCTTVMYSTYTYTITKQVLNSHKQQTKRKLDWIQTYTAIIHSPKTYSGHFKLEAHMPICATKSCHAVCMVFSGEYDLPAPALP